MVTVLCSFLVTLSPSVRQMFVLRGAVECQLHDEVMTGEPQWQ